MKRPLRISAIAFATLFLAALVWRMNQDDMLAMLMRETYGRYDAKKKTWQASAEENTGLIYTICAEREVDVHGEKHLMLAVCGDRPEMDSHGTPGNVDLYVLKGDRRKFTIAAQAIGIESGAYGQTGTLGVIKLGAAFHGFTVTEGWSGQGITLETTRIFVPRNATLNEALTIRTSLDNAGTGACDDDKTQCYSLQRELSVDQAIPEQSVYRIIVRQSGNRGAAGEYRLNFDRKRWRYVAPKGFDLLPE
jgi:hypothetical protein